MTILAKATSYLPLAVVVAMCLGAVVAALGGVSLMEGLKRAISYMARACRVAPGKWSSAIGTSVLGLVCLLLTGTFSFIGDWLLPLLAQSAGGFGDPRVRWVADNPQEWSELVRNFRDHYPWPDGSGPIDGDEVRWEAFKTDVERNRCAVAAPGPSCR